MVERKVVQTNLPLIKKIETTIKVSKNPKDNQQLIIENL